MGSLVSQSTWHFARWTMMHLQYGISCEALVGPLACASDSVSDTPSHNHSRECKSNVYSHHTSAFNIDCSELFARLPLDSGSHNGWHNSCVPGCAGASSLRPSCSTQGPPPPYALLCAFRKMYATCSSSGCMPEHCSGGRSSAHRGWLLRSASSSLAQCARCVVARCGSAGSLLRQALPRAQLPMVHCSEPL